MGGGVALGDGGVARLGDHLARRAYQHRTHRHLALGGGPAGQIQGLEHMLRVRLVEARLSHGETTTGPKAPQALGQLRGAHPAGF